MVEKNSKISYFVFISFAFLQSSYFNFLRSFQTILFLVIVTQKRSLNRYQIVTCENSGTQTTKLNLARHKKNCSAGILFCVQCPNFSTKSQNDLNYQCAKKHSAPNLISPSSVDFVMQNFPVFILYVNTKTNKMEHKWDSEQAIFMWRI